MRKYIALRWSGIDLKMIIVLGCLTFMPGPASAQFVEENQVTSLMDRWATYNETHQELRGWRIQVLASTDRRQAESEQNKFKRTYRSYAVHFVHNYPYYHLKVGAFMTMQKAQAFLYKIQQDFPQSIIVTDNLIMEELLEYDQ